MPRAGPDRRNRQGRFHVRAKAFFLTYPQATGIVLDDLFLHFKEDWRHGASNTQPQDVLVAKEQHEDGADHFHVFLRFNCRIDILNERAFDYGDKHPNIQSARSPKSVIQYCTKDGNFRSTFTVKVKKTVKDLLDEATDAKDFMTKALSNDSSWNNARAYNSLKSLARDHFHDADAESKVSDPLRGLDEFINIPDVVKEFFHDISSRQPGGRDRVMSLWIWGNTRLGKTEMARSLGKHTRIANVWNFECLDPTGQAQYLILDDISWESIKYQYKSVLGCQSDITFTGKYQRPTKFRFGIPAVVLSNELPIFTDEELTWLRGNLHFVHIIDKLF